MRAIANAVGAALQRWSRAAAAASATTLVACNRNNSTSCRLPCLLLVTTAPSTGMPRLQPLLCFEHLLTFADVAHHRHQGDIRKLADHQRVDHRQNRATIDDDNVELLAQMVEHASGECLFANRSTSGNFHPSWPTGRWIQVGPFGRKHDLIDRLVRRATPRQCPYRKACPMRCAWRAGGGRNRRSPVRLLARAKLIANCVATVVFPSPTIALVIITTLAGRDAPFAEQHFAQRIDGFAKAGDSNRNAPNRWTSGGEFAKATAAANRSGAAASRRSLRAPCSASCGGHPTSKCRSAESQKNTPP